MNEINAEELFRELARREWSLGTIECGVDGLISRYIFSIDEGPMILGDSLVIEDIEDVIEILDLPRPQFQSAGDLSLKAARAAARQGRSFLGANVCLVVWARALTEPDRGQDVVHIAVTTGQEMAAESFEYEGEPEGIADWLVKRAMYLLQQALEC